MRLQGTKYANFAKFTNMLRNSEIFEMKNFIILICLSFLSSSCLKNTHQKKAALVLENKKIIQEAFKNVVENMDATEKTITAYFSSDYTQLVDGKIINYNDFVAHMKAQKSALQSVKIIFKHLVAEGDMVATIHTAEAIKKNGDLIKVQVNAMFIIKNGKIISCDELTRLIEGKKSDADIGSRH